MSINSLGLAVAKGIVESHNGVIEARSDPGVGTIIIIKLPIRQVYEA